MTSQQTPAEDIFARAAEMVVSSSFHGLATMAGDLVKAYAAAHDAENGLQLQKIADALFLEHRRKRRASYLRAGIELAKAIAKQPPNPALESWANTAIVTRIKALRSRRARQAAFDVLPGSVHHHKPAAAAADGGVMIPDMDNVIPIGRGSRRRYKLDEVEVG